MTLIRRTPLTHAPDSLPPQGPQKRATGGRKMRRVWPRDDPYRGERNNVYWYIEGTSRENAIAFVAKVTKRKLASLDGEV